MGSLNEILKNLGQNTVEKIESRERAKIVNFSNIKMWHSPKPILDEPPNLVEETG
jgi:hypothetical protein